MRTLLLWLLLVAVVWGQPASEGLHPLTFRVWPAGTRIKLANSAKTDRFLGESGELVQLDSRSIPTGIVTLTFEKPGYKPETRDVRGQQLLSATVWPPASQPEVRLTAATTGVAVRDFVRAHPFLLGAFGLTLLGLVAGEYWRRGAYQRALRRAKMAEDEAIHKSISLEASLDPSLSISLNGYRIVRELGKGGMATVYEVTREGEEQPLALKLLHREMSENPDSLKRVRREVRVWRELLHPGIVPLLDFGEVSGRYYFVMDKVTGETLHNRLKQGRVRPADAIRYIDAMLEAVAYAHGRGVIHRDLKPDNIMLREDGRLQVLDFGISRSVDQQTMITMGDSVLGTPAYMAPERFSGQTDLASDQYALGLICFELLTGEFALGEERLDIGVLLAQHFNFVPPRMSSIDSRIPPELDAIVARMLEKDPVKRFPSVAEARQALHQALGKRGAQVLTPIP